MRCQLFAMLLAAAGLARAAGLYGGQLPVTAVDFTPAVQEKMHWYGEQEIPGLKAAILTSVSRAVARKELPPGLTVSITVRDIAPTRPTQAQSAGSPTLDIVHTKFIGGAELVGEVRDADDKLLTTVKYRDFPLTLNMGSMSFDPWADAQRAFDGFAQKLAASCARLPAHVHGAAPPSPSG